MRIPQDPMAALINAPLLRVISPLQILLIHEAVFYHGFKPPRCIFDKLVAVGMIAARE